MLPVQTTRIFTWSIVSKAAAHALRGGSAKCARFAGELQSRAGFVEWRSRLGQSSEGGGNDLLAEGEACQRNQLQICHAQGDADDGGD